MDQKYKTRDDAFAAREVRCPVTGEVLTPETSHVHHEGREFVELADEFAAMVGGYN